MFRIALMFALLAWCGGCASLPVADQPARNAWAERVLADDDGLPLFLGAGMRARIGLPAFLAELWALARDDPEARVRALRAIEAFPAAGAAVRGDVLTAMPSWSAYAQPASCIAAVECMEAAMPTAADAELQHMDAVLSAFLTAGDEENVATLALARGQLGCELEFRHRHGAALAQLVQQSLQAGAHWQIDAIGERLLREPAIAEAILPELAGEWSRNALLAEHLAAEFEMVGTCGPLVLRCCAPWCMRMRLVRQWCPQADCARWGWMLALFGDDRRLCRCAAHELIARGATADAQLWSLVEECRRATHRDAVLFLFESAPPPRQLAVAPVWVERVLGDDGGLAAFVAADLPQRIDLPAFAAELWQEARDDPAARVRALRAMLAFPAAAQGLWPDVGTTMDSWLRPHPDYDSCLVAVQFLEALVPTVSDAELARLQGRLEELAFNLDEGLLAHVALRAAFGAKLELERRRGAPLPELLREWLRGDGSGACISAAAVGQRLRMAPQHLAVLAAAATEWEQVRDLPARLLGESVKADSFLGPDSDALWCERMELVRTWFPDSRLARLGWQLALFRRDPFLRRRAAREVIARGLIAERPLPQLLAVGFWRMGDDVLGILLPGLEQAPLATQQLLRPAFADWIGRNGGSPLLSRVEALYVAAGR